MRGAIGSGRTISVLSALALAAISGSAAAQQPAPAPPPGYAPPPPGYYAPPPGAYAYPPPGYQAPPPAGSNEHDGFYLRLHFGLGYSRIRGVDSSGAENVFDGESGTFGLAIGGMVVRNLGLYGTLVASITDSPNYSVNGSSVGTVHGSASLFGFGGGVVYYLDPANVYFYGAIAGVEFDLSDSNDNTVYETKLGLGFQGGVGKEWWISPNWGLGVAAELIGASMPDKNDAALTWRGGSLSFLFSSTYN